MTVAVDGAAPASASTARPGPLERLRRSWQKHWYAYAMVAPIVVVLGVLVLYPLVQGVYYTLTDANSLNSARTIGVNHIAATYEFVGLHNYADILWGPTAWDRFWSHFIWTIVWTVACVTLHYTIGLALALLLNQKLRGRTFYRMMLILPWAVPTFVTVFSWRLMLSDSGIVNTVLGALHLPQPQWLERAALPAARRDPRQHLGRRAVHDGLAARRPPVHPRRAVRGRRDGRREPLAALPPRHPAGPAPGQRHRRPARHHLDVQPVR